MVFLGFIKLFLVMFSFVLLLRCWFRSNFFFSLFLDIDRLCNNDLLFGLLDRDV